MGNWRRTAWSVRVHGKRGQNEAQVKSGCRDSQSIGDKWRENPLTPIQPREFAVYLVLHVYHRRSWWDRSNRLPLPQPPLMLS